MLDGLVRVIAVLIGAVLVLGGGICTLVGVPTGLLGLFSGGGVQILFATAVGFGLLLVGLRLLKFGGGSQSAAAEQVGAKYLGKYVLITVTHVDLQDQPVDTLQMHGYAEKLVGGGLQVALQGKCVGQSWTVPLSSISPAQAGAYQVESSGEVVTDPDYVAHMRVQRTPGAHPA